jgi:hypothetical protein
MTATHACIIIVLLALIDLRLESVDTKIRKILDALKEAERQREP